MKFQQKHARLDWFAEQLCNLYAQHPNWAVDRITYVPMSYIRWWRRGYNQSAILARLMARSMHVPCQKMLRRRTWSKMQSRQPDVEKRWKNAEKNFTVRDNIEIFGKRILLIDDILTSGATVSTCARLLRQMGAAEVYVLCIAKIEM